MPIRASNECIETHSSIALHKLHLVFSISGRKMIFLKAFMWQIENSRLKRLVTV